MRRLLPLTRIAGVPVTLHWSVAAIAFLMLLGALENAWDTLSLVASYLGVMLLHEWGHLLAARRRRHAVYAIELYPIHGLTRCEAARSTYDACVIAWGGVLAQLAVGVPVITATRVFGFTPWGPLNAPLAMFGYFSVVVAVFNLLPLSRLDGTTAWRIVPEWWRRWRTRRPKAARPARPVRLPTAPREGEARGTVHKGPWVH